MNYRDLKDPLLPIHGFQKLLDSGYQLAYFRILNQNNEEHDSRAVSDGKPLTLEVCLLPSGFDIKSISDGGYRIPKEAILFRIAAGAPWPNIPENYRHSPINYEEQSHLVSGTSCEDDDYIECEILSAEKKLIKNT